MACNVVCISHATGAGGEEIGRLVAQRLGFFYVDEQVVSQAAAIGGVNPGEVADEERRRSMIARLLDSLSTPGSDAWALGGGGRLGAGESAGEDVRSFIRDAIEQTAARGNVVIVAHAASHAVAGGPAVLRVLVTASPQVRATRVGAEQHLEAKSADRAIAESDTGRRDYLKRFYGIDQELPTHYDLVVNTDVFSVEEAAQLVSQAAAR
jgi:hypothetical protein